MQSNEYAQRLLIYFQPLSGSKNPLAGGIHKVIDCMPLSHMVPRNVSHLLTLGIFD